MTSEKTSCIVIGVGKMGLLHGALANMHQDAELVAIVDPSAQSRLVARGIGIKVPIFRKISTPLKKWKGGVAIICTPPQTHFQIAEECLNYGWGVFTEKPLTMEAEKSLRLYEIASERGLYNQIGYQLRFSPVTKWLKKHVSDGNRRISSLEISILSPQFSQISDQSVGEKRGGIEWDLLPHVIDLGVYLTGILDSGELMVDRVFSEGWGKIEAMIHTSEGAKCSFTADWTSDEVRKVELRGKMTLDDGGKIGFDSDKVWRVDEGTLEFHRRSGENPYFEIADHEYSHQMLQIIEGFRTGERGQSADFLSGSIVDGIIEKILEVKNGHS